MKALKIVGIILLVLIALFFVVALFLPAKVDMSSSLVIDKPASLIFKQVNNYKNWSTWSPWVEADPAMENFYDGPDMGVGAVLSWKSSLHGDGRMTIMESVPYELVKNELRFMEEDPAYSSFILTETPEGTNVTWTLEIPHLTYPMERYFGLIMPGMMKKYFKNGLENLKEVVMEMPDQPVIEQTTVPETYVVTVLDSCHWSEFETKVGGMYGELVEVIDKNKEVRMAGAPFTLYSKWDETNQFAVFEAGLPVTGEIKPAGRVNFKVMPPTRAIKASHFGKYEELMHVYVALDEYIKEFGLEEVCCPMEVYVTDPGAEPDTAKWQTDVYFAIK